MQVRSAGEEQLLIAGKGNQFIALLGRIFRVVRLNAVEPPLLHLTNRSGDLVRVVRHEAELSRVAVRNIRRDAIHHSKELLKEKEITEDEDHRAHDEIQTMTDKHVAQIEEILAGKEAELMEV